MPKRSPNSTAAKSFWLDFWTRSRLSAAAQPTNGANALWLLNAHGLISSVRPSDAFVVRILRAEGIVQSAESTRF
jgi:hypothetical protein